MSATASKTTRAARSNTPVEDGRPVRSPISGETLTVRRTSAETGGTAVELDLELRPLGAPAGLPHKHLPTERFDLTEGLVVLWIAGQRPRLARAGETIEIPSKRWHFLLALSRTKARVSITPGMRFDELLMQWAALGSLKLSRVSFRGLAALLREHGCI